ncbi:MAG: class I SAM-dependent methyltransferase [FCB group bacterium]|nr:class I SAM-dependent methyltransferase [FCB group bacterium]
MNDIYTVPELYDAFHGNKIDDIPFLLAQAEKSKGPDVLELAAGTGRLAIPLIQAGFTYTGIELSPSYAQWARDKLTKRKLSGKIITGDMRSFSLDKKFDFIFVGFNSFLHLGTDQDALQCLEHIKKHLKPDGRFLVDIFVPNPDHLYRDPEKFYPVMSFEHPQGGECRIVEKTRYDSAAEILHVEWYFYRDEASSPDIYSFDMRMVYPDTFDRLITDAGLVIQEKLGNYDGSPLEPESPLQITIGCL